MEEKYCLITCIVNSGFSQTVINSAFEAGAKGATVINSHGSGSKQAQLMMGVTITPEKETVLMLVKEEFREKVMENVALKAGLKTDGQGIIYSQEVNGVLGVK